MDESPGCLARMSRYIFSACVSRERRFALTSSCNTTNTSAVSTLCLRCQQSTASEAECCSAVPCCPAGPACASQLAAACPSACLHVHRTSASGCVKHGAADVGRHLVAVGGDAGKHQVGETQAGVGIISRVPSRHNLLPGLAGLAVLLSLEVQLACTCPHASDVTYIIFYIAAEFRMT